LGKPLGELLKQAGIIPDFRYSADVPGTTLMSNHRRADGADIYFVANRGTNFCNATCTFRVSGKVPELWHPDTGKIEGQAIYQESNDGGTAMPLHLDPFGSVFVVFRPPAAPSQQVTAVKRDGMDLTAANVVQLRRESDGKLAAAAREPGSYALKEGKPDPAGRLTFTTYMPFKKGSPLLESGLLGPVMLRTETWMELK
jgi:hypothetical protein